MDSYHEDEINFGTEEANRMHAKPTQWEQLEYWIRTKSGQEFCDELVWGSVGNQTLNSLLNSVDLPETHENRQKLINLANSAMSSGEA